jgi:DNA-binding LytR/AlgR family response regulator
MLKIAIVDDSSNVLESIESIVHHACNRINIIVEITTFLKSKYLIYDITDNVRYDLYLLDIVMPDYNGMDIAKEIRKRDNKAYIIFITAYWQYTVDAFELSIYRYILKGNLEEKLIQALESINKEINIENKESYVINTKTKFQKIYYEDILYIYKEGKNSVFVCKNEINKVRKGLKEVYEGLNKSYFIFIERGYIANILYIKKYTSHSVIMIDDSRLPVSRLYMESIKCKITKFWGQKI